MIVAGGDGAVDNVTCGSGKDVVFAGSNDTVAADCERTVTIAN